MGSWDWDRVSGDCLWDDGQCRIFGVDPTTFSGDARERQGAHPPDDWPRLQQSRWTSSSSSAGRIRPNSACAARTARSAGASARPRRPWMRPDRIVRLSGVTVDITERQGVRGTPGAARPRGRPSRQECAGDRAVDRAPHPRRQHAGLRDRGRRPHHGAVARPHAAVAFALARRRSLGPGRRGAGALPGRRRRQDQDRSARKYRCSRSPPRR